MILVGYTHASIIGGLRPDIAYPDRKITRAESCVDTITAEPCECPDRHVAVFVQPITSERQLSDLLEALLAEERS